MLTGWQIREARALLRITQRALAYRARLKFDTICRAENSDALLVTVAQSAIIQRALEAAGVEFIAENGGGPGVRLRKTI